MELEKLARMVADVLSVDPREVTMDTTFMEELGADSLDIFQIVAAIEEEYHITITEEDATKVNTVRDALLLIEKLRNKETE